MGPRMTSTGTGDGDDDTPQHVGNGPTARAPEGFQTPPHDALLEAKLLGILMIRNDALALVRDRLRPEHFYQPGNSSFYQEIRTRITEGRLADIDALSIGLDPERRENIYRVAQFAVGTDDDEIRQIVNELIVLWQRREQAAIARDLANTAYDLAVPAAEWRQSLLERLSAIEAESPDRQFPPFQTIEHDDIEEYLPAREFLVEKWVPLGCVTSLYGPPGAGKSFLAMMMAMAVTAGQKWLQYDCRQGSVLGIMCEDDERELKHRRNKIARALGMTRQDVEGRLFLVPRVGEPNALMEFPSGVATRTEFFQRIVSEANRLNVRLIILDNAAQLFGGNENDRSHVTAFLNAVAWIAKETNGAVLLLGHPPKNTSEFSGSTAWDAVVRSRIWFQRIDDEHSLSAPQRYSLELKKSNYTKRFGVEIQENECGIVEYVGEIVKSKASKITSSERTCDALRSLFTRHNAAIPLDAIVVECIRRGIVAEAEQGTPSWRDRRRTVRTHLTLHPDRVDDRGNESYAIKP